MTRGWDAACQQHYGYSRVEELEGFNPQSLAQRLHSLRGDADGVGLIAQDHPMVREAIRSLHQANVPVVTLASDVLSVPRLAYVGIDNRQAGRLAGQLMGRFMCARNPAKVALFAGSLSYRGHEEREAGFRTILRDEFPNIHIMELREILDDSERGYSETRSLLAAHPDLAGIYNVGGGTEGIARALKEAGREKSLIAPHFQTSLMNTALSVNGKNSSSTRFRREISCSSESAATKTPTVSRAYQSSFVRRPAWPAS
jgi:LacI family transcriptional regulator